MSGRLRCMNELIITNEYGLRGVVLREQHMYLSQHWLQWASVPIEFADARVTWIQGSYARVT